MAQILLDPKYIPAPVSFPLSPAVVIALARERFFGVAATVPGLDARPDNRADVVTPILAWRPRVAASSATQEKNDPDHIESGEQWIQKS